MDLETKRVVNVSIHGRLSVATGGLCDFLQTDIRSLEEAIIYRGEGNTGIVLAFRELQHGIVLRVTKVSTCSSDEFLDKDKAQNQVDFISHTIQKLIGSDFTPSCVSQRVLKEELEVINRAIESFRPAKRKWKTLPKEECFGLIMNDFCNPFIPKPEATRIISVELKPKCVNLGSRNDCDYHLKQWLKVGDDEESVIRISRYCPMDLFSGCRTSMTAAVRALLDDLQNNLRIFVDGNIVTNEVDGDGQDRLRILLQRIFGESYNENSLEMLTSSLINALLRRVIDRFLPVLPALNTKVRAPHPCTYMSNTNSTADLRCPCEDECSPLSGDCVLGRVLRLQRLDTYGIKKIHELYQNVDKDRLDCSYRDTDKMAEDKINRFLLAATAKDCSVITTFSRTQGSEKLDLISIGIVDLDRKNHKKIPKWFKRDGIYDSMNKSQNSY